MESLIIEKQGLYVPVMAEIVNVELLSSDVKRYHVVLPDNKILGHKPGQFIEVSIFGFGEAPISISSSPTTMPHFELTVCKTGKLTDKMHCLKEGDKIGIRGPFGNGFNIDSFKGKDILFICGGIGFAPLKSLIEYTITKRKDFGRLIILFGAKNPSEIIYKEEIKHWQAMRDIEFSMTVDRRDEYWKGKVGVITTLIPPLELDVENTIAAIVGPPIMYKFVVMALKGKRIPDENIYLSLERRMKCGVGKCGHCQINNTYVCQDGPVFHFPQVRKMEEAL